MMTILVQQLKKAEICNIGGIKYVLKISFTDLKNTSELLYLYSVMSQSCSFKFFNASVVRPLCLVGSKHIKDAA